MVAVVWCRIFALWMLAYGLVDGAGFVGFVASRLITGRAPYQQEIVDALMFSSILPCAVFLLMAWYCWRKAPVLARRMAAGSDQGSPQRGSPSHELLHLILIGIGIYLLTTGISQLAWPLYTVIATPRNGPADMSLISEPFFSSIVRCGLGAWLTFGTHGLVILLRRHGGKWREESETPKSEIRNPNDESNPKSE